MITVEITGDSITNFYAMRNPDKVGLGTDVARDHPLIAFPASRRKAPNARTASPDVSGPLRLPGTPVKLGRCVEHLGGVADPATLSTSLRRRRVEPATPEASARSPDRRVVRVGRSDRAQRFNPTGRSRTRIRSPRNRIQHRMRRRRRLDRILLPDRGADDLPRESPRPPAPGPTAYCDRSHRKLVVRKPGSNGTGLARAGGHREGRRRQLRNRLVSARFRPSPGSGTGSASRPSARARSTRPACAQFTGTATGSPLDFFAEAMQRTVPAWAAYLAGDWGAVASLAGAFIKRVGGRVVSSPIKGTLPLDEPPSDCAHRSKTSRKTS